MSDTPTPTWTVHRGTLLGTAVDHAALEDALRSTGAAALVREESPDSLGVIVGVTGRNRNVAIVEAGEVVPGPPLFRFVDDLAAASGVEVEIGEVWAGGEVYVPEEEDEESADAESEAPEEAEADEQPKDVRVAAVTAMPLREVPFWTEDVDTPVAVLDRGDRRLVLAERPLGVGGWGRHALPVVELVVQDGEPSVIVTPQAPGHPLTWAWQKGWRPVGLIGDLDGKAAAQFADEVLGVGGMTKAITEALPGVEEAAVREALVADGEEGLSLLVRALGLTQDADEVLHGRLPALEVPGARVYEPRGIAYALGETVALETRGYGAVPGFWKTYREIAVERPRTFRAAVATEATIGALALATSLRSAGKLRKPGVAVGAWMLFDAAAELAAARWVARHTSPDGRFVPDERDRTARPDGV